MIANVRIIKMDGTMDLPKYETELASGMDLMARCYCFTDELGTDRELDDFELYPQERVLIKTGIKVQLQRGLEAQVRARSGLALKKGIMVVNGIGTIDADYTGEIGVILYNSDTKNSLPIKKGDKIAQLVFAPIVRVTLIEVDTLEDTVRADGGFGHTTEKK